MESFDGVSFLLGCLFVYSIPMLAVASQCVYNLNKFEYEGKLHHRIFSGAHDFLIVFALNILWLPLYFFNKSTLNSEKVPYHDRVP